MSEKAVPRNEVICSSDLHQTLLKAFSASYFSHLVQADLEGAKQPVLCKPGKHAENPVQRGNRPLRRTALLETGRRLPARPRCWTGSLPMFDFCLRYGSGPPPGKRPAKSGPDKSENPLNSFLVAGRDETLFSASRLVLGRVEQKLLVPSCFDER